MKLGPDSRDVLFSQRFGPEVWKGFIGEIVIGQ